MTGRPLIGICASNETATWTVWQGQPAVLTGGAYVSSVQAAGGSVVLAAPADPPDLRVLDACDGLLLPGGLDVDPASYGADEEPDCEEFDPTRDSYEIALTLEALARDMPLLGICRGMQVLNVALGGSLHQDIASQPGRGSHRAVVGSLGEASSHGIRIEPDTLTSRITAGATAAEGRSHHHQAVDVPAERVLITARSEDDGLPEAIEVADRTFAVGVQWHAEATPGDLFIPAFVEAARRFMADRTAGPGADPAG